MRTWPVAILLTLTAAAASADTGWVTVDRVAVVVNRDVVLDSELTQRLAPFTAELDAIADPATRTRRRADLRKEAIREAIDNLLAEQQATRYGITVEDSEIDAAITEIKTANKLDDAGLVAALAGSGYTMDKYRVELRRQLNRLKISNLLAARIQITDGDLRKAYDERKAKDPSGTGAFDATMKDTLRRELYAGAMETEMGRVFVEWRSAAYIDVRSP